MNDLLSAFSTLTMRAFYDHPQVMVMEELVGRNNSMTSSKQLAAWLHVSLRHLGNMLGPLIQDDIVKEWTIDVAKLEDTRKNIVSFYYIDWCAYLNHVKWCLYRCKLLLDVNVDDQMQRFGYQCKQCSKTFTSLEAQSLLDYSRFLFFCDVCEDSELQEETHTTVPQENLQKFMKDTSYIVTLLKSIDSSDERIPNINPEIEYKIIELDANHIDRSKDTSATVYDGTDAPAASNVKSKIVIEIEGTKAINNTPVAEVPSWHTHSSVTGESLIDKVNIDGTDVEEESDDEEFETVTVD